MRKIIGGVGPCRLTRRSDYFAALCQAIVNQQVSVAAGRTIYGRVCDLFPRRRPVPARMRRLNEATLRAAGLSRQKAAYVRGIAEAFDDGVVSVRRLRSMDDEALIECLSSLHGVGRWTAEMFLMFVLGRSDVLPVDDLGIRAAMQRVYGLRERPSPDKMRAIAEPWRPYRTVASWYLWRSLAPPPNGTTKPRAKAKKTR